MPFGGWENSLQVAQKQEVKLQDTLMPLALARIHTERRDQWIVRDVRRVEIERRVYGFGGDFWPVKRDLGQRTWTPSLVSTSWVMSTSQAVEMRA